MKVFIVIGKSGFGGEEVKAVFADEKKAKKYCKENYCYREEDYEVQK